MQVTQSFAKKYGPPLCGVSQKSTDHLSWGGGDWAIFFRCFYSWKVALKSLFSQVMLSSLPRHFR